MSHIINIIIIKKRNILNMFNKLFNKIINEATGLSNRKPGQIFSNVSNPEDQIIFQKLKYFKDPTEFKTYLKDNNIQLQEPKNINAYTINDISEIPDSFDNKTICLSIFTNKNNEWLGFARYVKNENQKWHQTGDSSSFRELYGYVFDRYKKQSLPISPSDLISPGEYTINELYNVVLNNISTNTSISNELKEYFIELLNYFANKNDNFPVLEKDILSNSDITIITNVFGEILNAFALAYNKNLINSNAFYTNTGINSDNIRIIFNNLKNDKLIDLIVKNNETNLEIGVSSKAEARRGTALHLD